MHFVTLLVQTGEALAVLCEHLHDTTAHLVVCQNQKRRLQNQSREQTLSLLFHHQIATEGLFTSS